jgi:hypothetical protein
MTSDFLHESSLTSPVLTKRVQYTTPNHYQRSYPARGRYNISPRPQRPFNPASHRPRPRTWLRGSLFDLHSISSLARPQRARPSRSRTILWPSIPRWPESVVRLIILLYCCLFDRSRELGSCLKSHLTDRIMAVPETALRRSAFSENPLHHSANLLTAKGTTPAASMPSQIKVAHSTASPYMRRY